MDYIEEHVLEILQWLWPSLADHLGYALNAQTHVESLARATEALRSKRKDVEGDYGEGPPRKRRKLLAHQAQNWSKQVSLLEKEVDTLKSKFEQRGSTFFSRCFSGYVLGKRAARMLSDVVDLCGKAPVGDVGVSPARPRVVQMQESLPAGQATSQRTLEAIWQCLHHMDTRILCVYGMGGVGKTTLMKTINNRLLGTQDFDVVIWVTVTKEFNLGRIQKEIGNSLHLDFHEDEAKSDKLFSVLKCMKYLLILDDLWQEFNLEDAGIPKPNVQNGCKIAITTRFIQVSNGMQADKQIKVNTLTKEDSWNLFCKKVGVVAHLPEIRSIAEEVVMECGGLPCAINTVGRTMRRKEKKELWLDALRSLKKSAPEVPGMAPKVFLSLKLSYDHLEDEKMKLCFLSCALFPQKHNIGIRKLVRLWTMEGLIADVDNLEDALIKGCGVIERLKEACLLEEGQPKDTHVKMHDLIRDLAIWITSSWSHDEPKFLVRAGVELRVPPKEEMWEEMEKISLMWNEIEELPDQPNCPKLISLLLANNLLLDAIPCQFFEFMPKLQVLDLSYTAIESLPMSLSLLVNLRALILRSCRTLVELPTVGQLKKLQFVDLSSSAITKLPEDFGDLTKLKLLNLSNLAFLQRIPNNVISRMSSLEDLRLLKTYVNWAREWGPRNTDEAVLGELGSLQHLATLKITIPSIDILEHGVFSQLQQRLCKFILHIGCYWFPNPVSCGNAIHLHRCNHFPEATKVILERAEGLSFAECSGLTSVSQAAGSSVSLRQLHIYECKGMDRVIDWREVREVALQRLERLSLDSLPNLKAVFEGHILQGSLQSLRVIEVSNCKKLRCLFTSDDVEHLVGLQELTVRSCDEMVEIIGGDTLPENALPQLSQLKLEKLYKMIRIVSSTALSFTNLQDMEVFRCPLLKKLPMCTSVQSIKGEREWWDALVWEDENTRSLFEQKYNQWPILPGH
ncbi:hypothetical protein ACLOJK_039629 [Asimina triloba]